MLTKSPSDSAQFSFFDIINQLDDTHPLLALSRAIDWQALELEFYLSTIGRKAKPIRLMTGLLILKQLYDLSDEAIVEQWQMNPYYQAFCGETHFQTTPPCHSTELVKFRQRLGKEGVNRLFVLSVALHGEAAEEPIVLVDTTVQEKAITYPTDSKLAIKIFNRLNKLAKLHSVKQRRTFVKAIIGHLKQDYRLSRNWLKGSEGDAINLLMAACAWNLRKWMSLFFLFEYRGVIQALVIVQAAGGEQKVGWLYFLKQ